eukprot:403355737
MDNYEKICEIGKGSFGSVSKIKRKADGKTLVWKELNYGKMSDKEKQQLVSEVNILRELKHPNIVRYYDRIIDKESAKIFIVMEYCEGGDMAALIKKHKREKQYVSEEKIWKVLAQMISGLYACHRKKEGNRILHRDLKPGNVFFDATGNVRIGDFGLSRMMGEESVFANTHVGTPYYMSPEQISDQKYNEKSDIWSAGCVIYELTALRAPFEATNQIQLAMKIKSGKIDPLPSQYSDELFKVIKLMMSLEKEQRPNVDELMPHPKISCFLKEQSMKDMISASKHKEEELLKKDKMIKKKEQDLAQQLKELEEKDKMLKEWEEKLLQRQSALLKQQQQVSNSKINESINMVVETPGLTVDNRNNRFSEKMQIEESPKMSTQVSRRPESLRRMSGNSQSRDALPQKEISKYGGLDSYKNNADIYMSNDNFQKDRIIERNYSSSGREQQILQGTQKQIPTSQQTSNHGAPLSYRKAQTTKDYLPPTREKTYLKPPILRNQEQQQPQSNQLIRQSQESNFRMGGGADTPTNHHMMRPATSQSSTSLRGGQQQYSSALSQSRENKSGLSNIGVSGTTGRHSRQSSRERVNNFYGNGAGTGGYTNENSFSNNNVNVSGSYDQNNSGYMQQYDRGTVGNQLLLLMAVGTLTENSSSSSTCQ